MSRALPICVSLWQTLLQCCYMSRRSGMRDLLCFAHSTAGVPWGWLPSGFLSCRDPRSGPQTALCFQDGCSAPWNPALGCGALAG